MFLILKNYQWNRDIPDGIIPALHCWYCVPSHAPYGTLWYIVSFPGVLGYTWYVTLVDFAVMLLLVRIRAWLLLPTYLLSTTLLWLQAPYDIPVLWMTLLGLISWPLIFLGPLSKLPLGAPYSTWNYVLTKPYVSTDWIYYGLIGFVFVAIVAEIVYDSYTRRTATTIQTRHSEANYHSSQH